MKGPQIDLHGAENIQLPNQAIPVTVGPTSIIGLVGAAPDAPTAVAASLVIGAANAAVKASAVAAGKAGNRISVTFVVAGNSTALSFAYDAVTRRITVNVATDAAGAAESTAQQVVTGWAANAAVIAVATLALAAGSTGATIVGALEPSSLLGGQDDPYPENTPMLINTSAQARGLGAQGSLPDAIADVYRTSGRIGATIVAVKVADDTEANITGTRVGGTGIYALLGAESVTGFKPRLIGAPGAQTDGITAALDAVAQDLRAVPVVTLDAADASAAVTAAATLGKVYACWPKLVISDGGVETERPMDGLVLGHIARNDREQQSKYAGSPSNKQLVDVLRTAQVVDWAIDSRTATANVLSRGFVTTAVRRRGGLFLWGNRLADGTPITEHRARGITGDALLSYIVDYIDRNVDIPFVEFVLRKINDFLRDQTLKRILSGGRAWFDPAENTESTLAAHMVTFNYDLGIFGLAEHIVFKQSVSGVYNQRIIDQLAAGVT